jgi:hypothetical protein
MAGFSHVQSLGCVATFIKNKNKKHFILYFFSFYLLFSMAMASVGPSSTLEVLSC